VSLFSHGNSEKRKRVFILKFCSKLRGGGAEGRHAGTHSKWRWVGPTAALEGLPRTETFLPGIEPHIFQPLASRYNNCDWLRAGRSGDRIPVGTRFSAPVQTGPGAHPASCTIGTGSFPGVNYGRGVLLTTHPLLVPRSWKSRAIPLPTLWATPAL
jgi:hypothetical protein